MKLRASAKNQASMLFGGLEGLSQCSRQKIESEDSGSTVARSFSSSTVRSTTETSMVGTRKAMPVSLPWISAANALSKKTEPIPPAL